MGVATAAGISFGKEGDDMEKAVLVSMLAKWYGPQPGGSLHDVYVVENEGACEGWGARSEGARFQYGEGSCR